MVQAILAGVLSVLTAAVMPVLLLSPVAEQGTEQRLLIIEQAQEEPAAEEPTVRLSTGGDVLELPLETYLAGVLICEMPTSFHPEARKAQAVAARTFTLEQMAGGKHLEFDLCDDSSCCQAWLSDDALREKLGESFSDRMAEARQLVEETAGQALYYEGSLIDAVYFSCSGGSTEAAVAVWGSEVPYLQSVDSPGEEQAARFSSVVQWSPEELAAALGRDDLTGDPAQWLGAVRRSEGGGVETLELGGRAYSGTELRSRLGLNSTLFSVQWQGGMFVFTVRGFGHRVGMSQYGANAMAENGSTYGEILAHYYPGTEIKAVDS